MKVFNKGKPYKKLLGVAPFAMRMMTWFYVHLANCGFRIFDVWRKFTRNEELIARLPVVMILIGIAFTKSFWKHIENIMVWFGYYEINFWAYLIYWIYSLQSKVDQMLTNCWPNVAQNMLISKIYRPRAYYAWNVDYYFVKYIHSWKFS